LVLSSILLIQEYFKVDKIEITSRLYQYSYIFNTRQLWLEA